MSDLTRFRDHCRHMAGTPVAPGCPAAQERALWLGMAEEIDRWLEAGWLTEPEIDTAPLWGDG